jgi:hypothetical protein
MPEAKWRGATRGPTGDGVAGLTWPPPPYATMGLGSFRGHSTYLTQRTSWLHTLLYTYGLEMG